MEAPVGTMDVLRKLALTLALATVALSAGTASATMIKDFSPVMTGAWTNYSQSYRNFSDSGLLAPDAPAANRADLNESVRFWIPISGGSGAYSANTQIGLGPLGIGSMALFDCLSILSFLETGNIPLRLQDSPAGAPSTVPEPSTLLLLAAGAPGIALLRRKIRK